MSVVTKDQSVRSDDSAANVSAQVTPEPQQLAMHRHDLGIRRPLAMIELASLERRDVMRQRKIAMQRLDRRELFEKVAASLGDLGGDSGVVIGKIKERRRRAELLSLKQ